MTIQSYGIYYAVVRGNIERILIGYDNNGDICGRMNPKLGDMGTSVYENSGQDLVDQP